MRNTLPDDQKHIICTLAHETFVAPKSASTNPIRACATAHAVSCIFILLSIPLDVQSQFGSGGTHWVLIGCRPSPRFFGLATRRRSTMSAIDTTCLALGSSL